MVSTFTAIKNEISNKYQNVAPTHIIDAVKKAAARTGTDFQFLMEKAAAESGFNPKATAKSSSAKGLYQFIDQTWLSMIKNHGAKYGLGGYAEKITLKDGKACVNDCNVRKEILDLRQNPEISALMAGEFSAENRNFLERNTKGDVGATELYLAHFMGAGGAAKFLNCKSCNPDAVAAEVFPKAARANKNVFFDKETGQPRTLAQIYSFFENKFTSGSATSPSPAVASSPLADTKGGVSAPASPALPSLAPSEVMAGTLPSFDDADESDDIIWNDDRRFYPSAAKNPVQKLSPLNILMLSEMQQVMSESRRYNS